MMKRQMVVRTYLEGWVQTIEELQYFLTDGWMVVIVTPLKDGSIEYIVEKEGEE